eukprot:m.82870 g.82870  ORF g.82870 m.82870 type:complete len:140 (+) comp8679_c0_seq5:145-564(+)
MVATPSKVAQKLVENKITEAQFHLNEVMGPYPLQWSSSKELFSLTLKRSGDAILTRNNALISEVIGNATLATQTFLQKTKAEILKEVGEKKIFSENTLSSKMEAIVENAQNQWEELCENFKVRECEQTVSFLIAFTCNS